jgi:hypothetical protein
MISKFLLGSKTGLINRTDFSPFFIENKEVLLPFTIVFFL